MKDKELWMKKLKEKLENYSEPIPASGWEQLEKELVSPTEKKIYPYRRWMFSAAAAVLVLLVSSLSLYFLSTPAADEIRQTQAPALASSPDALPMNQQPSTKSVGIEPLLRPMAKDRLARTERKTAAEEAQNNGLENNADESSVVAENNEGPSTLDEQATLAKENSTTVEQPKKTRRPSSRDKLHIPAEKSTKKGTWAMGLAVGNSGGTSTTGQSVGNMSRVSMATVANGFVKIPDDQTLVFEDGVPYLRQAKQVVDIEHHQPISFGLNVRKSLGKRFSLETGLTYTLLTSDAQLSGSDREIEQKLHYLGIPLRANWNFLDKKLFTLYVSGGGMIEKCVYGKIGGEKETVKPLQFSVSGAVGAQFNATKRLGIYVEPGVAYFFDDGSDVQTIRKESPFNFNLQAGVRLTY